MLNKFLCKYILGNISYFKFKYPISNFPSANFTKFEHNTSIGVMMKNFRTEFETFYRKRSFYQKKAKISFKILTSCDFKPP